VALVAVAFAVFTYQVNVEAKRDRFNASITTMADHQAAMLTYFFDHITTTVKFLQSSEPLKAQLATSPDSIARELKSLQEIYSFSAVYLTDKNGAVIVSTDTVNTKGHILASLDKAFFDRTSSSLQYSAVLKSGENYFTFGAAALGGKIIAFKLSLDPIYKKLNEVSLGSTGESYIGQVDPVSQK